MAWAGGAKRFAEIQQEQGYIRMEDLDFTKFRDVGAIKTNKYILLQAIPGCIPISLILTFLPDYLGKTHARGTPTHTFSSRSRSHDES